jgi:hypothetical protein
MWLFDVDHHSPTPQSLFERILRGLQSLGTYITAEASVFDTVLPLYKRIGLQTQQLHYQLPTDA